MTDILETIKETVVSGKFREIEAQVQKAIDDGIDLNRIINEALISAMDVVGKRFAEGDIYVPEMLVSARTMKLGLELIKPILGSVEAENQGTILIGTVKGDLHDIGKNLVTMMLEGAGFKVVDLGVDVKIDNLMETLKREKADILGLSALLTTTMPEMQKVIEALQSEGLRDRVKVLVGGAPIDQKFAEQIGADGYGEDAVEAVQLARQLVAAR
jgi:corrinoid protein of di/trimethylamine methyltransferase